MGNNAVVFINLINRRAQGKTYNTKNIGKTYRVERFVNKQSNNYL